MQLLPEYLKLMKESYFAEAPAVDFADTQRTTALMNRSVEEKTRGLIKDPFAPGSIGTDSRAVLINTIYFKGSSLLITFSRFL